jgi:hypothetical protein
LNVYKAIFHLCGTAWGYHILKNTPFLPYGMGGPMKFGPEFFADIPYHQKYEGFLTFALCSMGYYVEVIVDHLLTERSNDF